MAGALLVEVFWHFDYGTVGVDTYQYFEVYLNLRAGTRVVIMK